MEEHTHVGETANTVAGAWAAAVDGAAAFAGIDAAKLYRRSWNMMRLTGRGLADSSESPEVRVLPDSLSVFLR